MPPVKIPCISVTQPIGTFYMAVMKAGDLLHRVDIHRRGLDPASFKNVQRELSGSRAKEIASYVQDPDATFPTSIIVSAYADCVHAAPDGSELVFGKGTAQSGDHDLSPAELDALDALAEDDTFGEVIDGQHRLMGLELAGARDALSPNYGFELPVVFMLNLEPEHRAYVFSTINSKQTRVSSSLIMDLFGLQTTRSPRKTCHEVAAALNATRGGPFFSTLKMLGKKSRPTESLTQGSFGKYLIDLISRTPDADERAIKRGELIQPDARCPFRGFFTDKRDDIIVRILNNYFTAVQGVYPTAWARPDQYALRRTVGFAALMRALDTVWKVQILPENKATLDVFLGIAHHFAESVTEDEFMTIPSSGASVNNLAERLTKHWSTPS